MELREDCALFQDAKAASLLALERLEESTRKDYTGSLRRFAKFCEDHGYPNPITTRFVELPSVMSAFINQVSVANSSQWPAEKLRSAIAWHYSTPEMLRGGHPHDKWVVEETGDGLFIPKGNPAKAIVISQVMTGLNKRMKRSRTPTRASPMSLPMLDKMLRFLQNDMVFNETMRVWFTAVSSLCFFGMCRISEVLTMKFKDVHYGLERPSHDNPGERIHFAAYVIRDRKTDNDPSASRTYHMHCLPAEEWACEAYTHVKAWTDYAASTLGHVWSDEECLFPSLTRVPRSQGKKRLRKSKDEAALPTSSFEKVGVKWGGAMSDNSFIQVLNIVASASAIDKGILGDEIWFTSHCFRRGGAQYRFMFAPHTWSLKVVKWWAGWAPKEQSETLVRYLLDDVLDREENALSDALAPDMIERVQEISVNSSTPKRRATNDISAAVTTIGPGYDTLRDMIDQILEEKLIKYLGKPRESAPATEELPSAPALSIQQPPTNPVSTMSEFPEAASWRDYISQYWRSDPARHQFRAGVDFLPHEKKRHKARLSRMKLIAMHVRDKYNGDDNLFEEAMKRLIQGELTVNRICKAIRACQNVSSQ